VSGHEPTAAVRPLSLADWRRALPWLLLLEIVFLLPYFERAGGVAGKYIWDEHCVDHTYPVAWLARQQVQEGFFPLWNPHSGAGLPLLANTLDESAVPHALLKYFLPFPLGLELFIAVKILIALTGAFALGRQFGGSRRAAILAAVIFTFTGFIALNVNSVIGTVFVLPWCALGLHRMAERPRLGPWLLTAAAFGLSLLGGNPQIPFQALCLGYALYLFKLIVKHERFSFGRYVAAPATAVVVGAMVALPQLLPFVQYLARAFSHHLPGYGLLHLDPAGIIGVGGPHWDPAIVLMASREFSGAADAFVASRFPPASWADATIPLAFEHLGFGAVFFLALALVRLRRLRPEAGFFAAAAIANLGLAFGVFPFSLIARVPPFDQVSNWRFTTFMAALCVSALAAMTFDHLLLPAGRRAGRAALVALVAFAGAGAATLASRAGLPLTSPVLTLPAIATVVAVGILVVAVLSRRGAVIIAAGFFELLLWDRVSDRPLFPHPFEALDRPETWAECARPDPQSRFLAYGDVFDPSLGILVGRDDLRSYEMIFPEDLVRWHMAVNRWSRLDAVSYYMSHYYFAPEPESLALPETARAALATVMAPEPLPPSEFAATLTETTTLSPGPEYARPTRQSIRGDTRTGVFLHAPVVVRVDKLPETGRVAGSVTVGPDAWDRPGDGVILQLTGAAGQGRLFYSRYLDPRAQAGERGWTTFAVGKLAAPLAVSSLPGPKNDGRSDFGIFADLHDTEARARFEAVWQPSLCGGTRCYHRREFLPRLRVAERVKTVASLDECLEVVRERSAPEDELVVDKTPWPSGGGTVASVEFGANRVSAKVRMDEAGTLALSDTYYAGWKAELDGVPVPTRPANCAFRAVQVPAGVHEVKWVFKPEAFGIGLWAGLNSMGALVIAFASRQFINKRHR